MPLRPPALPPVHLPTADHADVHDSRPAPDASPSRGHQRRRGTSRALGVAWAQRTRAASCCCRCGWCCRIALPVLGGLKGAPVECLMPRRSPHPLPCPAFLCHLVSRLPQAQHSPAVPLRPPCSGLARVTPQRESTPRSRISSKLACGPSPACWERAWRGAGGRVMWWVQGSAHRVRFP